MNTLAYKLNDQKIEGDVKIKITINVKITIKETIAPQ